MKPALGVLILVAVIAGVALFRARTHSNPAFESTEQLVEWLAAEAVKDASQNNHVNLDYSFESIKRVDKILGQLHYK
ncbi:MAG TPA: hypothetical protein VKD70_17485 [Candidatus Acidoferrum sp.]|nr:hypothetical protein [Candidatus Acidoferrum sp.]